MQILPIILATVSTILPINPDKVCENKLNHKQILEQVITKENNWDEGYIVLTGEDHQKFFELWNRTFPNPAPSSDTLIIFVSETHQNSLLVITNNGCMIGALNFPLAMTKTLLRNSIGMRVND